LRSIIVLAEMRMGSNGNESKSYYFGTGRINFQANIAGAYIKPNNGVVSESGEQF